ncbi:hypothetical protein D4R71_07675 [bacterium]|nr:MAG: hypothetical protein D4R71_07675 [bacterium]
MINNQQQIIANIQSIEFAKYQNIDLDHLTMYTIGILDELNVDLSYENVVVAAFKLFPQKFSLNGFEDYPDSDRTRNSLNRCTMNKKWLGGKALHGFEIIEKSKYIISESKKKILGISINKQNIKSKTRRKELILSEIKKTSAFQKYINSDIDDINESDICYLLQGTLDTKKSILLDNFILLKLYAKELKNREILGFIKILEENLKYFFEN